MSQRYEYGYQCRACRKFYRGFEKENEAEDDIHEHFMYDCKGKVNERVADIMQISFCGDPIEAKE